MNYSVVYRYIDTTINKVVYVGIITSKDRKRCLEDRLKEHRVKDRWATGSYSIDYFIVNSRTDAEAFESHFIAYYETYKVYNKAKKDWGVSDFLPVNVEWKHYITYDEKFEQNIKRKFSESPKAPIKSQSLITEKGSLAMEKRYSIFWSADGNWHVYIPDKTSKSGRRRLKSRSKEKLEKRLDELYTTV